MDLILISDDKLKITLTDKDMLELNLDIQTLDYSNVSTKKAFWEILDKAKVTTGFDADKSKLYVQVFPSSDGGCEMFVTKYGLSDNLKDFENKYIYSKLSENSTLGRFLISDYDNISKLCKRLNNEPVILKSNLYKADEKKYILTLEKSSTLPSYYSNKPLTDNFPLYLSEYGDIKKLTKQIMIQIQEYCLLIVSDNAIKKLALLSD